MRLVDFVRAFWSIVEPSAPFLDGYDWGGPNGTTMKFMRMSQTRTVNVLGLDALEQVISAHGWGQIAGPEAEELIVEMGKTFKAAVQRNAPLGRGRLSQWQQQRWQQLPIFNLSSKT